MTDVPTPDLPDEPTDGDPSPGGAPGGGVELADDIAQEGQTGISSPDASDHAGKEAPASEGDPDAT